MGNRLKIKEKPWVYAGIGLVETKVQKSSQKKRLVGELTIE